MAKRRANHKGTIRQRSNGLWEAIISVGHDSVTGQLKRVSFYAPTQKDAIAKAAKARTDLVQGTFVAPEKMTLSVWLDMWLMTYKAPRMRQTTLDNYARVVRRHLQPTLGRIPLQTLKPEQIQHYCNTKATQGPAIPATHLVASLFILTKHSVGG